MKKASIWQDQKELLSSAIQEKMFWILIQGSYFTTMAGNS